MTMVFGAELQVLPKSIPLTFTLDNNELNEFQVRVCTGVVMLGECTVSVVTERGQRFCSQRAPKASAL